MARFKRILYVVDQALREEEALRRAAQLAREHDAEMTVIDVLKPHPMLFSAAALDLTGGFGAQAQQAELQQEMVELRAKRLKSFGQTAGWDRLQTKVLVGRPYAAIIRETISGGYDLVMKPSDANRFMHKVFGSLDQQLMRMCPAPVWIHKYDQAHDYANVLAAVEPGEADDGETGLVRKIMALATSVARRHGADLHVVHAWHSGLEGILREPETPKALGPRDKLEARIDRLQDQHRVWLEQLIAEYDRPDLTIHPHLIEDEPEDAILQAAKTQSIDLIVMGTVGRAGIEGLFLGNTADTVLQSTDRSVLAVKPDGFKSPIE